MTLIIIALCLFAERYLPELDGYRQPTWFHSYLDWSRQLPWGEWMSQSISGSLVTLTPLLLAIAILQSLFDNILGGIPELIFATFTLLFCLGPQDLQRQVRNLVDAIDGQDEDSAEQISEKLITGEPDENTETYAQTLAIGISKQAYLRTFSVIFWFVILGPVGAVLYRSCHTMQQSMPKIKDLGLDFRNGVNRLLYILDWAPVRITAFTYALSGNFHAATYEWWNANGEKDHSNADAILTRASSGAMGFEDAHDLDDPILCAETAQAMVLRSITIWLGLLTLITLTSWLS